MSAIPDIKIEAIVVGPFGTNCYLLQNTETGQIVVIDPGGPARQIQKACEDMGGKPDAILLTHGHTDHIMGIPGLKEADPALPVYAGRFAKTLLSDPSLNVGNRAVRCAVDPEYYVTEGETIDICGMTFTVIETPGHTAGSICFYMKDRQILFSGDTLFRGSYGRYDLATASEEAIFRSLRRLADEIPDETTVYPGHGAPTTIALEKQINPALS